MILLLHGDDTVKSRKELSAIKELHRGKEFRELDGKTVTETDIIQSLSSGSLFGEELVICIENLCSANSKKTKRLETLLDVIIRESQTNIIILWEEKEVGKTVLSRLAASATIKLFKMPTIIFQFLDGVYPGHLGTTLKLLETVLADQPPELIHAMLIKRIRQLILLEEGIPLENITGWQLGRLTNQCKASTLEKKVSLYKDMIRAELAIKTGSSSLSFAEHIQRYLLLNL